MVIICMQFALTSKQRAGRARSQLITIVWRPINKKSLVSYVRFWEIKRKILDSQSINSFDSTAFPAVLINLQNCIIEAQFHTYVRPTEHSELSKFCKSFTGINQEDVDKAVLLNVAIQKFDKWVKSFMFTKGLRLKDEGHRMQNTVLITWSDSDLGIYLPNECERKGINRPDSFDLWIDIRELYRVWRISSSNSTQF